MEIEARRRLAKQLAAVIAWELDAQAGVGREPEHIPMLVADSVLDYFDVSVKAAANLPGV